MSEVKMFSTLIDNLILKSLTGSEVEVIDDN